ncbi:hypothetical protein BDV18DRAFT_137994 [Aspergillus unguis]
MDDYSSAGGGGKLKLKGAKVSDGRVKKKKSKKTSSAATAPTAEQAKESEAPEGDLVAREESVPGGTEGENEDGSSSGTPTHAKTEAEKKHEETRRKRVRERLKREGVKTHKERVEELNKYLSRLSEHHDMPKIGPG